MIRPSADFNGLFGKHAVCMQKVCREIYALDQVERVVLYGSYAKGEAREDSDIDLAVFIKNEDARLLEWFRRLARICSSAEVDIQDQPFHAYELFTPCGIIEEIHEYGIELRVK